MAEACDCVRGYGDIKARYHMLRAFLIADEPSSALGMSSSTRDSARDLVARQCISSETYDRIVKPLHELDSELKKEPLARNLEKIWGKILPEVTATVDVDVRNEVTQKVCR